MRWSAGLTDITYHAVSKKQKDILNAFSMDENDVRSIATEISSLLTTDQSLQCSSKMEVDENGQDGSIIGVKKKYLSTFPYSSDYDKMVSNNQ